MTKQWQTFVRKFEDIKEGNVTLFVKDLTPGPRKYDTKLVEAIVAKSKEGLPDGEPLFFRSESGLKISKPWYIKIVAEKEPWVCGQPWDDVYAAVSRTEKINPKE